MIHFDFLAKSYKDKLLPLMFDILYSNMSVIAPTGNEREEDKKMWMSSISTELVNGNHKVILIYDNDVLAGYFKYSVCVDTFMMEDIQFKSEYKGSGLFQKLYAYLSEILLCEILYVEANVHKQNQKSQRVLKHLGLNIVGENKNGICYHFRGDCREVLSKYKEA